MVPGQMAWLKVLPALVVKLFKDDVKYESFDLMITSIRFLSNAVKLFKHHS